MIAVSFQYLLVPMALTTFVTHQGPPLQPLAGWSESKSVGMTHETEGSVPPVRSPKSEVFGMLMFLCQSGP